MDATAAEATAGLPNMDALAAAESCEDVVVTIGSNSNFVGPKRITKDYDVTTCPEVVNRTNWLGGYRYSDRFSVAVADGHVPEAHWASSGMGCSS